MDNNNNIYLDVNIITKEKDIQWLYEQDKKYIDSDLTLEEVINHHSKKNQNKIIYFRKSANDSLIGYCEYEWNEKDEKEKEIHIIWFLAPHFGERAMSILKKFIKKQGIMRMSLGVTLDKNENQKAGISRLNLYYKMGFQIYKQEWDKLKNNIVYLSMIMEI